MAISSFDLSAILNSITGSDFAISLAQDGVTLVIGSEGDTPAGVATGAAYVYIFRSGAWVLQATLTPADGLAGDLFGRPSLGLFTFF